MTIRSRWLALLGIVAAVAGLAGIPLSGATYTSGSTYDGQVAAANDWTPPTVTLTNPGSIVSGNTALSASATDDRGTVSALSVEYSHSGDDSWTTVCSAATTPLSCTWATALVPDGAYDLRARATDDSGLQSSSDPITVRVANTASVVLSETGDNLHKSVTLAAAVAALPGGAKFSFSYAPADTTNWTTICAQTTSFTASATCVWNTTALTGSYDIRVQAASTFATAYSDMEYSRTVDNTAPVSVGIAVPSGTLSGVVNLVGTADDSDSGIDTIAVQYRLQGASAWTLCGSFTDSPYTFPFDTTKVADGAYEFRTVATDLATNQATSSTQLRTVSNTVSSVSITSPAGGSVVRGNAVAVTAAASSNRGVTSVRIEAKPSSGGTWAPLCSDATAPYTCTWDTTAITLANYDLRAILTDGSSATTTSNVVTVSVDNSVLQGSDVQVINASSSGKPSTGDRVVLTYSTLVATSTVKTGWNGSTTTIAPTFYDRGATGSASSSRDNLILTGTNLGSVTFAQDYLGNKKTAAFTGSTMAAATQTIGGVPVTVITVTLGTTKASLNSSSASGAMLWTPSGSVTSPSGIPCSTKAVTESGASDKDF